MTINSSTWTMLGTTMLGMTSNSSTWTMLGMTNYFTDCFYLWHAG